jgi:hypothetical protein
MSGGNHIKRMDPCEHNGFNLVMTALDGWMDGWVAEWQGGGAFTPPSVQGGCARNFARLPLLTNTSASASTTSTLSSSLGPPLYLLRSI